jgi:hypothetical protein
MTINVKVKVWDGAEWDAEVVARDYGYPRTPVSPLINVTILGTVKPGEEKEFCATDTRDIIVREVRHAS